MENTGKRSTDFFAVFGVKRALFLIKKSPKALKYKALRVTDFLEKKRVLIGDEQKMMVITAALF